MSCYFPRRRRLKEMLLHWISGHVPPLTVFVEFRHWLWVLFDAGNIARTRERPCLSPAIQVFPRQYSSWPIFLNMAPTTMTFNHDVHFRLLWFWESIPSCQRSL